jgi:hypothetical protein
LGGAILRRLVLGLAVFAAVVAAIIVARNLLTDWDRIEIEAERARRLAQASVGSPLAGTPDLLDLPGRLSAQGLALGAPVFIRIFKREFELELWLKRGTASGVLRPIPLPLVRAARPQAPGGRQPGAGGLLYGRRQGAQSGQPLSSLVQSGLSQRSSTARTSAPDRFVMVHGGCARSAAFAMTDPVVDEICAW